MFRIGVCDMTPVRVRVVHQIDPAGSITGGIDSVIRGVAKAAPDDIEISIVGLTEDPVNRPVGRWTEITVGMRCVRFFAVGLHNRPMQRGAVPLSVRLTLGLIKYYSAVSQGCDVFEFHRVEPSLVFFGDGRRKTAFVHQNMDALYNPSADIGWKRAPWLFFALEKITLPRFSSVFGVREDAVRQYKEKYPAISERFQFVPTWMDPEVFRVPADEVRVEGKVAFHFRHGLSATTTVLVSVGRLDQQKNPLLLIDAFSVVARCRDDVHLMVVGDGALRKAVEERISAQGLAGRVTLLGLMSPDKIAEVLISSDLYVMSSAYEGMPISVLEALACGLPIVSTRVGELPRLVDGTGCGLLVSEQAAEPLSQAILELIPKLSSNMRASAVRVASNFVPDKVLSPVFESYRAGRVEPISA